MGHEKPKKWQLEHSDLKMFCDLDMSILLNSWVFRHSAKMGWNNYNEGRLQALRYLEQPLRGKEFENSQTKIFSANRKVTSLFVKDFAGHDCKPGWLGDYGA